MHRRHDLPAAKGGYLMGSRVHLRVFTEADLQLLVRFATEPDFSLPFEWSGFGSPGKVRRQWEENAFLGERTRMLAVAADDGVAVGWVMWRDAELAGRKGWTWEIGMILSPEHRGHGVGTAAHRLLVRYLFDTTTVNRICAYTEIDNMAEQRVLEKCGFRREGVLRKAGFRGGKWRDGIVYALLREEAPADGEG
ncbi:MAG: GNAT family N-acetyltransferase [Candidatus Binataceae bacterium]